MQAGVAPGQDETIERRGRDLIVNLQRRGSVGPIQRRRLTRLVFAAVALVVVAMGVGFLVSQVVGSNPTGIAVTQELTGTVSMVNSDQTHLCMIVPGAADSVCSSLWLPTGTTFPAVGSRISVWVIRVSTSQGAEDSFILKP